MWITGICVMYAKGIYAIILCLVWKYASLQIEKNHTLFTAGFFFLFTEIKNTEREAQVEQFLNKQTRTNKKKNPQTLYNTK